MAAQKLRSIPPSEIQPNPENPRLIFRQEEMDTLLRSIDRHGIQVPITVYQDGNRYLLIDGERRWRCAKKLNLKTIPAIVQDKPSELDNLVLMYNIHALREQWDYYTIASKLTRVIELFQAKHCYTPTEQQLSELTGLTRAAIRRCQLLINLPDRFKDLLIEELDRPKTQQRLTEDFFIEMERSIKTIVSRLPEYDSRKDDIRDALIDKFKRKVITAVTDFRQLAKIATAVKTLGVKKSAAVAALNKIFFGNPSYGIRQAYTSTVQFGYVERRATQQVESLSAFLQDVIDQDREGEIETGLIEELKELKELIDQLLES